MMHGLANVIYIYIYLEQRILKVCTVSAMQMGLSSCISDAPFQLQWPVQENSHYDYITTALTASLYITCKKKNLTLVEQR